MDRTGSGRPSSPKGVPVFMFSPLWSSARSGRVPLYRTKPRLPAPSQGVSEAPAVGRPAAIVGYAVGRPEWRNR